jgi:hypothetical protein
MHRIARFVIAPVLLLGLLALTPATTRAAASIGASPQNVPFGQSTTTITFATGGASGTVCVAANGGTAAPFASGAAGNQQAAFIQSGSYVFALHAGSDCAGATLASTTVQKLTPDGTANPSIVVTPASFPVQAGTLTNTATVSWDVGNGTVAAVAVAVNGGGPIPFASATFGSVQVPWVQSGAYVFTMTYGSGQTKTASATALAGLAAAPMSATAPANLTVTANSGNGAPVLICLQTGTTTTSTPFTLGNSGIASGQLTGLAKNTYIFTAYVPADGKTALTSVATGTGGAQCTANTPLAVARDASNMILQIVVTVS